MFTEKFFYSESVGKFYFSRKFQIIRRLLPRNGKAKLAGYIQQAGCWGWLVSRRLTTRRNIDTKVVLIG